MMKTENISGHNGNKKPVTHIKETICSVAHQADEEHIQLWFSIQMQLSQVLNIAVTACTWLSVPVTGCDQL